jgi:hypothetical protein
MSTNRDIEFQYADYQERCLEELETGDSDVVVLRTGYGGGKSYAGAQWIHEGSMGWRKGSPGLDHGESLVLAPDFQKGGPATYRVFFETLPGEDTVPDDANGDPENSPIVAGYNQNKRRVTYVSGHVVRLGSADKWNRYAGSEFHRIWMDEPSHYDNTNLYDLHEMLISRQRTQAGPNTSFWTSTGSGYNQFYDITERQVDADDEPLSWADTMTVIVESSLRNPFLPSDAKAKLRRQFEDTGREEQALHGGFAAAKGLVYEQFTRTTHVKSRTWIDTHVDMSAPPIYGYDAGWGHPRVLVQLRPTNFDQWAATRLYYETERPFEDLCDPSDGTGWVYEEDLDQGPLYAEHEPEHIQKFSRAGFDATQAEKSLDEGIPHVRGRLETDSEGRPGLVVGEDLVEFIQEFQSYKEEHVGSSGDVPDHVPDAVRYALFTHAHGGDDKPKPVW